MDAGLQLRIASAPARRQGFARCARRLTPPLTAAGAPAKQVISSRCRRLLHSSTTGSNTKFLTPPARLDLVECNFMVPDEDRMVGGRHHLYPDLGWFLYLAVVLDAFSRRIVAGRWRSSAHRAGARSTEHGAGAAAARRGDPSFRPRQHSTRRLPSAYVAGRPARDPRWARSVIASTMPCARAFSLRSNASCSTAAVSAPKPRRAWRSSSSSRAGRIPIAATPPSTICRQSTTKGATTQRRKPQALRRPLNRGNSSPSTGRFR